MNEILNQNGQKETLSQKYKHVKTIDVLKPFFDQGWQVSPNGILTSPRSKYKDLTKHIVRLEHPDYFIGHDKPQLIVTNSYDGTSCLEVNLGIFRLVCSNGLILGDSFFHEKIKHIGHDFKIELDSILKGALDRLNDLKETIHELKITELNHDQEIKLAEKIFSQKLKNVENLKSIDLEKSMLRERNEDYSRDAWTILNVIQEKLIRGGIHYEYMKEKKNDQGQVIELNLKNRKTKAINSPAQNLHLNKLAFDEVLKLVA